MVLLAIFVLANLSGCAIKQKMTADAVSETPIAVQADFDSTTDFSRYTSWSWIPSTVGMSGHEIIDSQDWRQLVDLAVEKEMFARGYVRDTQNPSLLINAMASIEKIDKKYIEEHHKGYYFPEYHSTLSGASGKQKDEWDEGTLMLFIIDAATQQVVYFGAAKTEVYEWVSEPDRERRTREGIRLILESLPARAE
jgi:hypothetical protein